MSFWSTITDPNLYYSIESYIDHGFSYDVADAMEKVSDWTMGIFGASACIMDRMQHAYYDLEDNAVLLARDAADWCDWLAWRYDLA